MCSPLFLSFIWNQRMLSRLSLFAAGVFSLAVYVQCASGQEEEETPLEKMSGKQIYVTFCARCHGEDGTGHVDPEILAGMEAPPPDFTDPYFSSREKRKDWHAVVAHGGSVRGLSMSMPAWNDALTDAQIAETVEYIKSFINQDEYPQGELNFIRGHFTTKAFVEQEALLIPSHQFTTHNGITERQTRIVAYYANRFGKRFQYEVKAPFFFSSTAGTRHSGIGDLELGWKYAFYDNYRTLSILTLGIEAALPTGSTSKGFGAGTVVAIPYLAAAQGIGNHLQLSTSLKLETPLDRSKGNPELRFSLLSMLTLAESKQGLFPGAEMFMRKDLAAGTYSISLTPQVYWGITPRGHLALSMGYEIPIAGSRPFDGTIVAFLLWDYVDGGLWW